MRRLWNLARLLAYELGRALASAEPPVGRSRAAFRFYPHDEEDR